MIGSGGNVCGKITVIVQRIRDNFGWNRASWYSGSLWQSNYFKDWRHSKNALGQLWRPFFKMAARGHFLWS